MERGARVSTINNQCARLLKHLMTGKKIDAIKAWDMLGIYRLSARIWDLREMGHEIDDDFVHGKNKFGESVKWKEYYMEK